MGTYLGTNYYICTQIIIMKVTALIRKSVKKNNFNNLATVYFRIRDGKKDFRIASELSISSNHWSDEKQGYKDRVSLVDEQTKRRFNNDVRSLLDLIEHEYSDQCDKEWLAEVIDRFHHPERYKKMEVIKEKPTFEQLFDEFLRRHELSDVRKKNFHVVKRALLRYELYVQQVRRGMRFYSLNVDEVSKETLEDIWDFFKNEYIYFTKYPEIYESIPEKRTPAPRGKNTLIDSFSRIRTFFIWCYDQGITKNRPFDNFPIEECLYGDPIYITIEERNQLFHADLSSRPQLAIQRDIFVFQSVIGCRVSDLYRLAKSSIVNGAIEYIQKKTKEDNPRTIRVPLNEVAKTILNRYADYDGDKLFPFISEQKYNKAIKECFKIAGCNRLVTVIDPLTREPIQKPLYKVVTSHTARKTFIGNMYKKVKDPDLVSSLSGHKEGSRAFRRYRNIDEEIKKDLVKLLD